MTPQSRKVSRLGTGAMLAVSLLMVASIAYFSYRADSDREVAAQRVRVSRSIRNAAEDLLSSVKDAETGARGFVIIGRESYLEPYNAALPALPLHLQKLESLTTERVDQKERIQALAPLIRQLLQELNQAISVRRTQGLAPAQEIVETGLSKSLMDEIRLRIGTIQQVADGRVNSFTDQALSNIARLRMVATYGSICLLVFISMLAVNVFRGLDHRERLYAEAITNSERFRVTLQSIGDAIIATDASRKITFINPIATQLTGWTAQDAIGQDVSVIFRIVHEVTRQAVESPLEKSLETGEVVGLANHTVLLTKDGREVPIDDTSAPIRGPKSSIEGAILVFRDVSERRATERQLKASNEQLKEFVDGAAHDLRAPLRSISAFSHLLETRYKNQLAGDSLNYLTQIRLSVQRMARLLDDLLSYTRATYFEREGTISTSMTRAFQTAVDNLRADLEDSKAVVESPETLPTVPVQDTHLVLLFQNLIGNAVKYRGEHPPRIEVSCRRSGTEWMLEIKDNGIGIAAEYRDLIFRPFKRLHGDDRPGSGIGLATCQKIVNGYGGRIWVESTVGEGSTFCFTLPAAEEAQELAASAP